MAKNRYSNHELVEQLGGKADVMRTKTVTIVGLGAVGSVLAEIFTRAGINLRVVDKGRILEEELQRQSLFLEEDINKFKAKQSKKRLSDINPHVSVKSFHEELTKDNVYLVESDLVIDCSNDINVSLMLDKYCYKKKIPMIYSYVSGTKGQVFIVDKKVSLEQISEYVINKRISEEGVMAATIHTIAGIISSKAAKLLLGVSHQDNMLDFDIWDFTFDKKFVRKNK
ncbi:ThiF family adenylyltransferase [Candidatus Woesearchaeota archaeon]|nr:ThiF family adenylyltransferase [Candidatus Woesearchaeota archaeon]MCF7901152.1 ThiF family adenylyltransferase [Candidatus Woesearchaeota archaeon]MCF8013671.1 ThiF family adenylyltransferase [Candidatus Woesearchaeota archaeon]